MPTRTAASARWLPCRLELRCFRCRCRVLQLSGTGGPADGILKPDDNILSLRFIDSKAKKEAQAKAIEFEKKPNWCSVFWEMQSFPGMPVELVVRDRLTADDPARVPTTERGVT